MSYQKYIKYKHKYLNLKNKIQVGGNFYFAIHVFSKEPLDQVRIDNMIKLLKSLYGGEIIIDITGENHPELNSWIFQESKKYIELKGGYESLIHTTAFIVKNVPTTLTTDEMNDAKLSAEEYRVRNELTKFSLNTLHYPRDDPSMDDFSRGWGFSGDAIAVITLVE